MDLRLSLVVLFLISSSQKEKKKNYLGKEGTLALGLCTQEAGRDATVCHVV